MLGSFGPGMAAAAVIGWLGGTQALRDWLDRCVQWHVGLRPFAWTCLRPPAVLGPAALVQVALGGSVLPALTLGMLTLVAIGLMSWPARWSNAARSRCAAETRA
jgi:hypothetical protein